MTRKFEDYEAVVKYDGLNTDRDAYFGGDVNIVGDFNAQVNSRTVTAVVGKTEGDFRVSNYVDTSTKSAFQLALEAAYAVADKVLIRNSSTPYTLKSAFAMSSGKTLEGESVEGVILQMNSGRNATVITNADAASGITTDVVIRNMTIDQQGTLQAAGGGIVCTGIQWWKLENLIIKKSYRMNFLCLHQGNGMANKAGTATFTNGSEVVTGSGTQFTTELEVGDIVKSAGAQFVRVAKINSNTEFISTIPWGYTTETGVTFKVIEPNSFNYFKNVEFQGTVADADASGYGFCDDSIVEDCIAHDAFGAGCGFVPDHARGMRLINCKAYNNDNSGFSYETCEDIVTTGGKAWGNGNGYQLISGCVRCIATDMDTYDNVSHGLSVSYNITGAPVSDENTFNTCHSHDNGGYGIRIDGSHRNMVNNCRFWNNDLGGGILNVANARIPQLNTFSNCKFYDTRTTKIQAYGIRVASADQTKLINCEAKDSENVTAGLSNAGTNTTIISHLNGNTGFNNNNPANLLSVNVPTTADTDGVVVVTSPTATSKPLIIQANSNQSANLVEIQSSAGNNFASISGGGRMLLPSGTASAPGLAHSQDGDTGIYRPGGTADTLRITTGGVDRAQFDNTSVLISQPLDVDSDTLRLRTAKTPSSASDTGNAGQIAWDSSYIYVCTATNTWKRVAIATW